MNLLSGGATIASSQSFSMIQRRMLLSPSPSPASPDAVDVMPAGMH
jgi:hypothetical protein